MVPVATAHSGFEAKVLAARLGSDGIVWQFRGGNPDGVYPVGDVEVLVREDDLALARELLLSDAVEAALEGDGDEAPVAAAGGWTFGLVLVAVTLAVIGLRLLLTV